MNFDKIPRRLVIGNLYFTDGWRRCLPAFIQRVHIFWRFPSVIFAHCKLTWSLTFPVGLNLVARIRLEYPPPTRLPLSQIGQIFAMDLVAVCYHVLHIYAIPLEIVPAYDIGG